MESVRYNYGFSISLYHVLSMHSIHCRKFCKTFHLAVKEMYGYMYNRSVLQMKAVHSLYVWITYLLHGAGDYLKSWLSLSLSKNPAFLWIPKVHYRVHTSPPLDPIMRQLNPVRATDPYLPKVHLNVILPPTPRSSQWSLAFGPQSELHNLNNLNYLIRIRSRDWNLYLSKTICIVQATENIWG
jgi:hypothetical protein